MKFLNRDFTHSEKVALLLLLIVVLGLSYYHFVDQVVRREMAAAIAERDDKQSQLDAAQTKLGELTAMQRELEALGEKGMPSTMASYNNIKTEVTLLNRFLLPASQYSISFGAVSRSGNQIRRVITLSFTTSGFRAARGILENLANCEYRCLLGNISYGGSDNGQVTMSLTCTFYETMVGGEPDENLPAG